MLFIVSDLELNVGPADAVDGVTVEVDKAPRGEVRALLALPAEHRAGARLGRAVRPLRGRARRAGAPVTAPTVRPFDGYSFQLAVAG